MKGQDTMEDVMGKNLSLCTALIRRKGEYQAIGLPVPEVRGMSLEID